MQRQRQRRGAERRLPLRRHRRLQRRRRRRRNDAHSHGFRPTIQTTEGGGSVMLTNDPYPSKTFVRSSRNGQRFRHYQGFSDSMARETGESQRNSLSDTQDNTHANMRYQTVEVQGTPRSGLAHHLREHQRNSHPDVTHYLRASQDRPYDNQRDASVGIDQENSFSNFNAHDLSNDEDQEIKQKQITQQQDEDRRRIMRLQRQQQTQNQRQAQRDQQQQQQQQQQDRQQQQWQHQQQQRQQQQEERQERNREYEQYRRRLQQQLLQFQQQEQQRHDDQQLRHKQNQRWLLEQQLLQEQRNHELDERQRGVVEYARQQEVERNQDSYSENDAGPPYRELQQAHQQNNNEYIHQQTNENNEVTNSVATDNKSSSRDVISSNNGHSVHTDNFATPDTRNIVYSNEPDNDNVDSESGSNYLIFSQTSGSTGTDGSFNAEAEGTGPLGESAHSMVNGNDRGASASASAVRHDQQALAHVQVSHPSSVHSSPSYNHDNYARADINTPGGISKEELEELMRRQGYTGFALATVTARKRDNNHRPYSNLEELLPGYSTSISTNEDTHDMVDSIVEQVYDPSSQDVIIDHGGLEGGAGDPPRESEIIQINTEVLPEGSGSSTNDDGIVGLATYGQGIHGYPPGGEITDEYPELDYEGFEQYTNNHYYSGIDYNLGIENRFPPTESHYDQSPIDLNTRPTYPIIEGDVPPDRNRETGHMIVDNTLSSYFPQSYQNIHQPISPQENEEVHDNTIEVTAENSTELSRGKFLTDIVLTAGDGSFNSEAAQQNQSSPTGLNNVVITEIQQFHTPLTVDDSHVNSHSGYSNHIQQLSHPQQQPHTVDPEHLNFEDSTDPSVEYPPVLSTSTVDITEPLLTNDFSTPPPYNPLNEYENSQQRGFNFDGFPGLSDYHSNAYVTGNMDIRHDEYQNIDDGNKHSGESHISTHRYEEDDSIEDSEYDDTLYDSFDSSSQTTSSQSSQSIYAASHHYTYQRGSHDGTIGSSTNAGLISPTYRTPHSEHSRPTLASHSAAGHPSISQEHFASSRPSQPSASQGMNNMQVLIPGNVGTIRRLPSADPNFPEVRVVMAEAPNQDEIQQRTGREFLAGEKIPGTVGYSVPTGFRGRLVLDNGDMSSIARNTMMSGTTMRLNSQMRGQMFPSDFNNLRQNMQMMLGSSSSANSAGSGSSLSSSSSAADSTRGSISVSSTSTSNQFRDNLNSNNVAGSSQPVYSYYQTFNVHPNQHQHPNQIQEPSFSHMDQNMQSRINPGMRSKSWSSWRTTSWRTNGMGAPDNVIQNMNGGNGMGAPDNIIQNMNGGNGGGQYFSQSSSAPSTNDCGYWSMNCQMVYSHFQQNELCRPTHIILPCCC